MDRDGSNLKQLTNTPGYSNFPYVSPDGKWVVYHHNESETPITLWKVPIDGGTPVQITADAAVRPSVSPDGQRIACWYWDMKPGSTPRIAIIPMTGGAPVKLFPVPALPS